MSKQILFIQGAGNKHKPLGSGKLIAYLQEQLGSDYEVLAPVGKRVQALAVVDHVDAHQRLARQLRVVATQLGNGHPIDVADIDPPGQA